MSDIQCVADAARVHARQRPVSRTLIAGFKTPKSVETIAVLPRNPSGKVLRRELRAPYWQGKTRQVG